MRVQSAIEASLNTLSPAMRQVADVIRKNPAIVLDTTVANLALACGTSVATVVRFCRVVGLSGYAQLRRSLAMELGREAGQFGQELTFGAETAKSDTLQEMAGKVAALEMLAIEETVSSLDFTILERIVAALDRAERILLFGIGASRFVAQDLHHKLFRVGRNAFLLSDPHEAWSAALLSPPRTVAVGFSHSGESADTVRFLKIARQNGALAVAITGSRESPLATAAEERLIVHARESGLRPGAMASRIAQLALVDCLFLGLARRNYDETVVALQRTRDIAHPTR